jgi:5,10-methylene-tetrahydrofolate dehydrogenase/methenyl tetrahydrofolate cyclohydrolase
VRAFAAKAKGKKNGDDVLDRSKLDPKKLINGNEVAQWYREKIREEAEDISSRIVPGLAVVLVGSRPDSATYVMAKSKFAQQCGFRVIDTALDESATEEEIMNAIDDLNQNPQVHGILVQLPLPSHINEQRCLKRIAIQKDVDGFSGYNIGNLTLKGGDPLAHPCTPAGVLRLMKYYKLPMSGKKCVILGRSNIVGTPLALLMLHADATVTICHSKTKDIEAECLS